MGEREGIKDTSPDQPGQASAEEGIDHSPTQTAGDVDTNLEPVLVEEIEFGGIQFGGNAYHDTYRNGNFGVKRGRVHLARAKIWSVAHFLAACTIVSLSAACIISLTENHWYWIFNASVDYFVYLSPICGSIGLLTSCGGIYFSFALAKLRRPLFVLLLVRVLSLLECILLLPAIICTIIVPLKTKSEDPWWRSQGYVPYPYFPNSTTPPEYSTKNKPTFTGLCGGLAISMVVDWFTAVAWLFHWWRWCVCCQCLKSCCIFEPGEPLAPGVPDPPTGFLRECVYVFWVAIRSCSKWALI